ncbi:hypothetical protein [Neobacillus terrae]|uniref:hypothetical protein n=1 Tax=Neobacillus terrae TaxID=3034837 RepID=UPI00140BEACF|nr:hypothetical protein [Neobacillus terrae]NHM33613.1 hypothetical protein [Neobacillus terrae]
MQNLSIKFNNLTNEANNLDLHDAELRDIYCSYDLHEIEIPVIIDTPKKRQIKSKLKFIGVLNFNLSFLEPWGPGIYINEMKISEGEGNFNKNINCEILLNSGDKIKIISSEIIYSEGV